MRHERLAYAALVVAIFGWGSLAVAAKPVVPIVGAPLVALDRTAIAAILLSAVCIARDRSMRLLWLELASRPVALLLLGITSFFASSLLMLVALNYIPASVASILNNLSPLWLAIGTAIWGKSRRPFLLATGSGIALAGVALILAPQGGAAVDRLDWRGVVICTVSSFVIAAQAIIGRRLMPGHDPLAVTAASAIVTVPLLLAASVATTGFSPLIGITGTTVSLLVYLGVFCTAANFACFNYALKYMPATRAANITYLIPCVSVVLAVLILHEHAGWNLVAGLTAAIAGIVLAHRGTVMMTPRDSATRRQINPVTAKL